jgi:transcriptional regulator with XRE-family HTH domain
MEIHARIKQLLAERGWTEYRLSRECGLAQTTIGNLVRRNTLPSMATLETICKGFGISMAQFFAEGDMLEVTPELKEVFDCWVSLTPDQKKAALAMLKAMNHDSLQ